jgi:hypothetical protein
MQINHRKPLLALVSGATLLLTAGCNDTGFSTSAVILPGLVPPSTKDEVAICDPFSNGGASDPKNGIYSTLHYYEVGDSRISSIKSSLDFMPGVPGVVSAPNPLYLNRLDVPTRSFSDGFVGGDGQILRTLNGESLIEWFSLRMSSNFVAPVAAEDGHYQFALNSDDGAILRIDENRNGNFVALVDSDTIHAPVLKCATRTVEVKTGSPLPFKLEYFQGPRYHITLQLLWRKLPAAQSSGLTCSMNELSVVPAQAFELEAGRKNPCAGK